jgi:large subunit ribosomal protein L15
MVTHNNINATPGSLQNTKRLGRGNGSGKGTFCGKGCKGQNARKGSKFSPSFE